MAKKSKSENKTEVKVEPVIVDGVELTPEMNEELSNNKGDEE